jgi:hypothetical protein
MLWNVWLKLADSNAMLLYVIYRFVVNVIRFPLKVLFKCETINDPLSNFLFIYIYKSNK